MYVLKEEDLGKEFLNEGLKISPNRNQIENINEPSNIKENEVNNRFSKSAKKSHNLPGKIYESDMNNSIEEAESFDESDGNISFRSAREIAGYNFAHVEDNENVNASARIIEPEGELFSSDDES